MDYNLQKFTNGLKNLHILLTDKQLNQFLTFYEMMVEKNKSVNLTAITEFEEVVEKHFLDSLCLIKSVDLRQPLKILGRVPWYSFKNCLSSIGNCFDRFLK